MDWLTQLLTSNNKALDMKNWQMILLIVIVVAAAGFVLFAPLG